MIRFVRFLFLFLHLELRHGRVWQHTSTQHQTDKRPQSREENIHTHHTGANQTSLPQRKRRIIGNLMHREETRDENVAHCSSKEETTEDANTTVNRQCNSLTRANDIGTLWFRLSSTILATQLLLHGVKVRFRRFDQAHSFHGCVCVPSFRVVLFHNGNKIICVSLMFEYLRAFILQVIFDFLSPSLHLLQHMRQCLILINSVLFRLRSNHG